MDSTITVQDQQVRGLIFLLNGQQCETWLPDGDYAVLGKCTIRDRDGAHHPMVQLERRTEKDVETWYAAPNVLPSGKVDDGLVARTVEQESMSCDGVFWWREWRARPITSDEYYRLHLDCPYQEWLLEVRYLCRLPDGRVVAKFEQGRLAEVDPDQVWQPMAMGRSLAAVIDKHLGDSSFAGAQSLCDEHRQLVAAHLSLRVAVDAERKAKAEYDAAAKAVGKFKVAEERKFTKRHGHRTGPDLEKWKQRTLKRVMPRLDELRAEAKQREEAWRKANELRIANHVPA